MWPNLAGRRGGNHSSARESVSSNLGVDSSVSRVRWLARRKRPFPVYSLVTATSGSANRLVGAGSGDPVCSPLTLPSSFSFPPFSCASATLSSSPLRGCSRRWGVLNPGLGRGRSVSKKQSAPAASYRPVPAVCFPRTKAGAAERHSLSMSSPPTSPSPGACVESLTETSNL